MGKNSGGIGGKSFFERGHMWNSRVQWIRRDAGQDLNLRPIGGGLPAYAMFHMTARASSIPQLPIALPTELPTSTRFT